MLIQAPANFHFADKADLCRRSFRLCSDGSWMRFVNTCIAARVVEPIIESCGETSSGIVVCGGKLSAIWSQTETQTAFLRCEATSCFFSSRVNTTSFLSGFRYRFSPMAVGKFLLHHGKMQECHAVLFPCPGNRLNITVTL